MTDTQLQRHIREVAAARWLNGQLGLNPNRVGFVDKDDVTAFDLAYGERVYRIFVVERELAQEDEGGC